MFALRYTDSDGDEVTIASDADVQELADYMADEQLERVTVLAAPQASGAVQKQLRGLVTAMSKLTTNKPKKPTPANAMNLLVASMQTMDVAEDSEELAAVKKQLINVLQDEQFKQAVEELSASEEFQELTDVLVAAIYAEDAQTIEEMATDRFDELLVFAQRVVARCPTLKPAMVNVAKNCMSGLVRFNDEKLANDGSDSSSSNSTDEALDVLLDGMTCEARDVSVHLGVICDGCEMDPLVGVRYKSLEEMDFDLCQDCEASGKYLSHEPFIKITDPSRAPKHKRTPDLLVHPFVVCDGCEMSPLVGPRFKSKTAEDFDLCQACEASGNSPAVEVGNMAIMESSDTTGNSDIMDITDITDTTDTMASSVAMGTTVRLLITMVLPVPSTLARHHITKAPVSADMAHLLMMEIAMGSVVTFHHLTATVLLDSADASTHHRVMKADMDHLLMMEVALDSAILAHHLTVTVLLASVDASARYRITKALVSGDMDHLLAMEVALDSTVPAHHLTMTVLLTSADAVTQLIALCVVLHHAHQASRILIVVDVMTSASTVDVMDAPQTKKKDVTIEDGTVVEAGKLLRKMWKLVNDGERSWPDGCYMIAQRGNSLFPEGVESSVIDLPPLAAGEEFIAGVDLISPTEPGRYSSFWRVCDPAGESFGHRFWIDIVVAGNAIPETTPSEATTADSVEDGDMKSASDVVPPAGVQGMKDAQEVSSPIDLSSDDDIEIIEPCDLQEDEAVDDATTENEKSTEFEKELMLLNAMGFIDPDKNIRALELADGNVGGAVNALLSE
ncbi:hypothetical protein PHMEG_0008420 [Phytophthora megakarya]|uniref:ZZ-type domain-containing protein n=1 Tax=Phytophthora megakarya TaxID=4795 RepID=A0A225WIR7_9STRA|nr:hypothetical protein PHMEG_0008420 [Phytophthora megakarya]